MYKHVRWMIRRDMPEVLEIESQSFEFPWDEDTFMGALRQRNCIGMVVEMDEVVAGFMIYELHKSRLHVLNFAVHPDYRRQGVGQTMTNKLISKLTSQRRTRILLEVKETNVEAQQFFKAQGFRAVQILKDFYEERAEDAYLMEYRYQGQSDFSFLQGSRFQMLRGV